MALYIDQLGNIIDASKAAGQFVEFSSYEDFVAGYGAKQMVRIAPTIDEALTGYDHVLGRWIWNEAGSAAGAGYSLAPVTDVAVSAETGATTVTTQGAMTSITFGAAAMATAAAIGVGIGAYSFEQNPELWTKIYNKTFGKAFGTLNPTEIAQLAAEPFPVMLLEGLPYVPASFVDLVKNTFYEERVFDGFTGGDITGYYEDLKSTNNVYPYSGISYLTHNNGKIIQSLSAGKTNGKIAFYDMKSRLPDNTGVNVVWPSGLNTETDEWVLTSYLDDNGNNLPNPTVTYSKGPLGIALRTKYWGVKSLTYGFNAPYFQTEAEARAYLNNGDFTGLLNKKPTPKQPAFTPMTGAKYPNSASDSIANLYPSWYANKKTVPVIGDSGLTSTDILPITIPNTTPFTGQNDLNQPQAQTGTQPKSGTEAGTATADGVKPMIDGLHDTGEKVPTNVPSDSTGKTPVALPPAGTASALWTVYNPTKAILDNFGKWLWSANFIDQLMKMFNNPADAIIGLHKIFITPTDGASQNIKVGYLDSGVASPIVTNQYCKISCGSVSLPEYFGNCQDYSQFTALQIYLPFVGFVKLNVNDVMAGTLKVDYTCDVLTGAFIVTLTVTKQGSEAVLYQYGGNMGVQYPLSSGSYASVITSLITTAAGVAGTVATGGAAAPIALGGAVNLLHSRSNVSVSGGFSSQAGAMASKIPYLVVTRPVTANAYNYNAYYGLPSNITVTLGDCTGFTKVKNIFTKINKATDTEKEEIKMLLESGVIL